MCVGLWSVCVCVFIHGSVLLCMLQMCGNICIHNGIMVSFVSPFSILLSQSLGFVSWVHVCVCVYIHACACVYTHVCTHVYTWRDVRMQMHVLVYTHTHPGTHPCVCMYVCAPCSPRHDPPLTPPMRQDEWTPLFFSAQDGHTDTVRALLQAGATVDAKDEVRGGALLSECMCVCFRIRV
jgi:hypothetical protein